MRALIHRLALLAVLAVAGPAMAEEPVRVFAAASLTNALNDIGAEWQKAGHPKPSLAYAASSALAKQIEAGAPADVFASADLTWMDYLDQRNRIAPGTRVSLLGNDLVLIVPKGRSFPVQMTRGFDFAGAFTGKLCTGEPGVVPVGIYAKQGLENLGWWAPLKGRIVGTDDVRTALAFVERGECPVGIVYATDARISSKVEVLAQFPGEHAQAHRVPVRDGQGRTSASPGVPALRADLAGRGRDLRAPRLQPPQALTAMWLSPEEWDALRLSAKVALWSTAACLPFGVDAGAGCWSAAAFPASSGSTRWCSCRWCCRRWCPATCCCCCSARRARWAHGCRNTFGIVVAFTWKGAVHRLGRDGVPADGATDPARLPSDRPAAGKGRDDAGRAAVARVLQRYAAAVGSRA